MAHVGYDIEAIGPFLDAAEAVARRLCVAVLGEGAMTTVASLFWAEVHGEARIPLPALPELLALLVARGRLPEVRIVDRKPPTFDSLRSVAGDGAPAALAGSGLRSATLVSPAAPLVRARAGWSLGRGPCADPHRHRHLAARRPDLTPPGSFATDGPTGSRGYRGAYQARSQTEKATAPQCDDLSVAVERSGGEEERYRDTATWEPEEAEDPVAGPLAVQLACPVAVPIGTSHLLVTYSRKFVSDAVHRGPPFSAPGWCGR